MTPRCSKSLAMVMKRLSRMTTRRIGLSCRTRFEKWSAPIYLKPMITLESHRLRTSNMRIMCKPPIKISCSTTLTQMKSNFSKRNSLRKLQLRSVRSATRPCIKNFLARQKPCVKNSEKFKIGPLLARKHLFKINAEKWTPNLDQK